MNFIQSIRKAKGSKFNNKKTVIDGVKFDSKKEARVWLKLEAEEKLGLIKDLKRQVRFDFPSQMGGKIKYESNRTMTYVADFAFYRDGKYIVMDAKGFKTPEYKIKKALMFHLNGISIVEV